MPLSPRSLLGRPKELALLRDAWCQARSGGPKTILVVGPAGIGKSHFMRSLAAAVQADGDTVLFTSAARADAAPMALPGRVAAELGQAIADALVAAPRLWLIEDLHRLDPGSCAWLTDLAQDLADRSAPTLLVGSSSPARATEMARLLRDPYVLELEPFDASSACCLARDRAPARASEARIAEVVMIADGNPGFLTTLAPLCHPGTALPTTWADAAAQLLAEQGGKVRRWVEAASILAGSLSRADAIAGFGLEPAELPPFLEDRPDGLQLAPSALADLFAAAIPAAARAVLHGRAGALVEARSPLAAALHYERAGDPEALRRCLLSAASAARDRFALEDACHHLGRALAAAAAGPAPVELVAAQGQCLLDLGRYVDCAELLTRSVGSLGGAALASACRLTGRCFERMGEFALAAAHHHEGLAALPDRAGREGLLAEIATIELRRGDYAGASGHAREAISQCPDAGSRDIDLAQSILGICYYRQGRLSESLAAHRIALAGREDKGDLPGVANALNNLASVHCELGEWEAALRAYERGLEIAKAAGEAATASAILNNLANLHLARGDLAQAEHAARQALADKLRSGEPMGLAIARATLAALARRQGDLIGALAGIEDAIADLERLGAGEILAEVHANAGELLADLGRPAAAWASFHRSLAVARAAARIGVVARVYRGMARLLLAENQRDEGLRFATRSVELARESGRPLEIARSLQCLAQAEGNAEGPSGNEASLLFAQLGIDGS